MTAVRKFFHARRLRFSYDPALGCLVFQSSETWPHWLPISQFPHQAELRAMGFALIEASKIDLHDENES
jgi:hypothetical protein